MKLNIGLINKLHDEIQSLDEGIIKALFKEQKSKLPKSKEKLIDSLEKYEIKDISSKEFRNLWRLSELANLFLHWTTIYQATSNLSNLNNSSFKGKNASEYTQSNQFYHLDILKKPKLHVLLHYSKEIRYNKDKASVNDFFVDRAYIFPDAGLVLTETDKEENNPLLNLLQQKFGDLKPHRIRTYNLSKIFSETDMIELLAVKAIHEITGFSGLEEIVFEGNHVKEGLYGLHRRQDIRVNLDQIGPRVAVNLPEVELKIGPKLKLRSLEGVNIITKYLFT